MKAKKLKVLIVDDAVLVVKRLSVIINELDCINEVKTTGRYDEAISLLVSFAPDIILLDIQLPEKSGIELLEYVKTNFTEMKVVMLTNQASSEYKHLCERLGSDHFVDKSSEFENIPLIIKSYKTGIIQQPS
ncbi:MAG: response regulator [Ferruginibacter sp.]